MERTDKINVCLSCDDNYAQHAGVVIASILQNANPTDDLDIYILDGGVSEEHKRQINSLKSIKDCNINFIPINENDFDEYKKVKTLNHITFATFYRLKLPSLLPNIKKVIYLDCDIVVVTSLKELFETDIKKYYLAGCEDIGAQKIFTKYKNYVNAGMLLFNLDTMREKNVEQIFLEYTKTHINNLKHSDQDIINYSCKGHIQVLDGKWNVQSSNFINRSNYTNEPKIIHFIAKRKPWKWASFSYHRDIYFKYLQLTPWKLTDEEYKHWTKDNQIASLKEYIKYRPFFFLRPRLYAAAFYTYLLPLLNKLSIILKTLNIITITCIGKVFLEGFVPNRQIRAILKGKLAQAQLKKYVIMAYKKFENCNSNNNEPTKILWQYWEQGIETAPDIVKACIKTVEKNKADYQHIILDFQNLSKYVAIPEIFYNLKEKGIIKSAHFSDIVRTYLLEQNGGVWLDATLYFVNPIPQYILNSEIFLFQNNPKQDMDGLSIASYFIVAKKHHTMLKQVENILENYWKDHKFLNNYYMFLHAFTILTQINSQIWNNVPFFNYLPLQRMQKELLAPYDKNRFEQFKDISFVHKLTYKRKVMEHKNVTNFAGTLYEKIITKES